jgi:hypothetical protein
MAVEDDDFCEEVQDLGFAQTGARSEGESALFIRNGTGVEWCGVRAMEGSWCNIRNVVLKATSANTLVTTTYIW